MKRICIAVKKDLDRNIGIYKRLLNDAVAAYTCLLRSEVQYMVRVHQSTLGRERIPTVAWGKDLKTAIWKALEESHTRYPISPTLLRNRDVLGWLEGRITVFLVPTKGPEINICRHEKLWRPYVESAVKRLLKNPKRCAKRRK